MRTLRAGYGRYWVDNGSPYYHTEAGYAVSTGMGACRAAKNCTQEDALKAHIVGPKLHPDGGQFDFARSSARTSHGAYVWWA